MFIGSKTASLFWEEDFELQESLSDDGDKTKLKVTGEFCKEDLDFVVDKSKLGDEEEIVDLINDALDTGVENKWGDEAVIKGGKLLTEENEVDPKFNGKEKVFKR
jgi:hypothetical protein